MDGGYLLDFVVTKSSFDPNVEVPDDSVYIIFQTDGSQNPVPTFPKPAEREISWDFPARIFLHLNNLSNACLYATLCSYSGQNQSPIPIGRAKLKLRYFPVGNPKQISFNLMNPENSAMKVGTINLTANIAAMLTQEYPMAIPINR